MAKKHIFDLVASIVIFIIGIFLASNGLPSSPNKLVFFVGEKIMSSASQNAPSETFDIVKSISILVQAIGVLMTIAGIIKFTVSLFSLLFIIIAPKKKADTKIASNPKE